MDGIRPWTIKGIPPEDRSAAIAAARRNRLEIGQWVCRAIRTQIELELRPQLPAVIEPPVSATAPLSTVEQLIGLAAQMSAATSEPVPKVLAGPLIRLLRKKIREAAG